MLLSFGDRCSDCSGSFGNFGCSRQFRLFPTVSAISVVPDSSDFCVIGNFSALRWPFWLYVRATWADTGLASALLAIALPLCKLSLPSSLCLSCHYSPKFLLSNSHCPSTARSAQSIFLLRTSHLKKSISSISLCVFLNEPQASILYISC